MENDQQWPADRHAPPPSEERSSPPKLPLPFTKEERHASNLAMVLGQLGLIKDNIYIAAGIVALHDEKPKLFILEALTESADELRALEALVKCIAEEEGKPCAHQ